MARLSRETLQKHGVSPAGAGWADGASQTLRFSVLIEAVGLREGDAATVNDLGCGYGALYDYLMRSGIEVTDYTGYDISDEMLAAARGHVAAPTARFFRSPTLKDQADFSFLSGPFNHKSADDEAWMSYAESVVLDLAANSRRGLAFNMMTTKVTYRVDDLYYADADEWLSWCRREVSPNLKLFEDYPLYEWTIGGLL